MHHYISIGEVEVKYENVVSGKAKIPVRSSCNWFSYII